jgi:formylglycine-generating enzyme required for sulfatase activity
MDHDEFDCFLSHNSGDKPAARALAARLWDAGVSVWLDEEQAAPGPPMAARAAERHPRIHLNDHPGNVWDWCLDKYGQPGDTDTTGEEDRSLRGSSWSGYRAFARAACRDRLSPDLRDRTVGCRLVCACPIDADH